MSEDSWTWGNHPDRAASAPEVWTDTIHALPIGTRITGEVVARQPFGAFLAIDGHPDAIGLAGVNLKPRCMDLPAVGERVFGEVFFHAEYNHQVGVILTEWALHEDLIPEFAGHVGQIVTGRATDLTPVGVSVRLADCVYGFVPLAKLPAPSAEGRGHTVREGQEIRVRIVSVDLERNRISLSAEDVR
ncbi:S1 RNA-binding domain-containing protein [Kitasatospora sp. NPDC048365]|uniref:S1 RNA-binding domain-containing protein n=1 Tax=Kitasatospora sp. NPDC048365 TaxID=3364050 RepID=UPI00371748CC